MRTVVLAAAALAAAFLFLVLPLPARPVILSPPSSRVPTASGSFHIHTNRSDGSGSPDEVAAAAARSGLNFIVLTDHGDGTRAPDPPRYRSGVLAIDAVELSTDGGHYIAIGLPQAPYPLRGEARDVVDDVRRLGGFGIVAHPDSAKPSLRWTDWNAPFDAMEWLNADTEWRDEGTTQLARALIRYPFRPAETLASLLDRPDAALARWDSLTQKRQVVALAGVDAHARAGWMDDDATGYRGSWFVKLPSYETSFRTFSIRLNLNHALRTDAAADAAEILSALKAGRVYSAVDALAGPPALEFRTKNGESTNYMGEVIERGGTFVATTSVAAGGVIVLRKDGQIVAEHPLPEVTFDSKGEEGTYRAEVHLSNVPGEPPVPWIVSNPIYVRRQQGWGSAPSIAPQPPAITLSVQGGPWHIEKDDATTAQVSQPTPPQGPVTFTYRLAGGERGGQHAALAIAVGKALTERTHLAFRAYASRPLRVSVQARHPGTGDRWKRSIYLDAEPRDAVVRFADMTPVGSSGAFDPALADTLLFVVDATNTLPGTDGSFSVEHLRIER